MPDILIHDVPEDVLDMLKRQAKQNGRSLEHEFCTILERPVAYRLPRPPDPAKIAAAAEAARAIRERLAASGRDFGDSVQDLREDRDR